MVLIEGKSSTAFTQSSFSGYTEYTDDCIDIFFIKKKHYHTHLLSELVCVRAFISKHVTQIQNKTYVPLEAFELQQFLDENAEAIKIARCLETTLLIFSQPCSIIS